MDLAPEMLIELVGLFVVFNELLLGFKTRAGLFIPV